MDTKCIQLSKNCIHSPIPDFPGRLWHVQFFTARNCAGVLMYPAVIGTVGVLMRYTSEMCWQAISNVPEDVFEKKIGWDFLVATMTRSTRRNLTIILRRTMSGEPSDISGSGRGFSDIGVEPDPAVLTFFHQLTQLFSHLILAARCYDEADYYPVS